MDITVEQFSKIADLFPKKRGNLSVSDYDVMRAILYVAEHGCKWRGLPAHYGNWHTIYTRMNRWAKNGLLDRIFLELQRQDIIKVDVSVVGLDSTSVKVHPDGTGALKKTVPSPLESQGEDGQRRFIWLPRMLAHA